MRKFLLTLLLVFSGLFVQSQLLLNEVTNNNDTLFYDEDADATDYIELFHLGPDSINLSNYYLSDNSNELSKFQLPSIYIQPGDHYIVLASGKNRTGTIHHYETAIYENDVWNYIVPVVEPDTSWIYPGFVPTGWLTGAGGFGYSDGDDNTTISNTNSVYFFKSFTINDTSDLVNAILHMDYDDGFVAYLNGIEIARNNLGTFGQRPAYNLNSPNTHEALMYSGGNPEEFVISPTLLKSIIFNGTNVLAIQVHNQDISSSDLSSRAFLSFGIASSNTYFGPTPPFFAIAPANFTHTNFKINNSGETIYLTNGTSLIDTVFCPALSYNHAYARETSGASNWCFTTEPSPNNYNIGSVCYSGYVKDPIMDLAAGYYPNAQTLTISLATGSSGMIYYSLDGDNPDASELTYTGAINIPTTRVIRARVFPSVTTELPSKIVTRTYLINENFDLPVFSISTDSINLWDPSYGIYVLGYGADSANYPYFGANFWMNWERPMHVEYFHKDKQLKYHLDGGLKIHGGWSRARDQKSLRLLAKSKYDNNVMNYPMISDKPYINSFHAINLRNGGNDYDDARSRDAFMQRLVANTHVDYMGYEPAYAFLNGNFFGHYEIREREDASYVENNHLVSSSNVDILSHTYWGLNAVDGTTDDFLNLHNEITTFTNPTTTAFYQLIDSKIDLFNLTDYMATELYLGNADWAYNTNNTKFWHQKLPYGKWRWALWDVDFGLGYSPPDEDFIPGYLGSGQYSANILSQMLNNPTYRNFFINRNADLINTVFQPANFTYHKTRTRDSLVLAIQVQNLVWGSNGVAGLNNSYDAMETHNLQRMGYQRNFIQSNFGLIAQVDVTLNVSPANAGYIKISTITPGPLPWTGVYFNGNPVTITAYANPGFTFNHWNANAVIPITTTANLTNLNITTSSNFTAVFTGTPQTTDVVVSEINYNSDNGFDSGNWIELWNPTTVPIEMTGFSLQNGTPYNKIDFPDGTRLEGDERIIIASDFVKFTNRYPNYDTSKLIVHSLLQLENNGDSIQLINQFNNVVFNFSYTDSLPWKRAADGTGRTMELKESEFANFRLPESWITSCMYGTPGEAHSLCDEPLVISEINYKPSSITGEWFELYNNGNATLNLNGFFFKDSKNDNIYTITSDLYLESGEFLVISADTNLFHRIHQPIKNVIGNFNYSLSNNNEVIRVYNSNEVILYSVWYDDNNGWPTEADGQGKTLESFGFSGDVNEGVNWFVGCPLGSPGWPYKVECYWGEEYDCLSEAEFYFNSATAMLEVQLPYLDCDGLFFHLVDAKGAAVTNAQVLEYKSNLNLSFLSSGIYFVSITNPTTGQKSMRKWPVIITGQ